MRGAFTIAGRDMKSVFFSPLFFFVAGLCTMIWSFLFYPMVKNFAMVSQTAVRQGGESGPNLHYQVFQGHASLVNFIMILACAAFTMRLFSEEKRQRTFDLLLTSPVTATDIVLGKFLAGFACTGALVLVSLIYPLTLALYTPIQWGPLASAYLGLFLTIGTYTALGIFASSLTENSLLSVLMSLMFSVMLWFVGAGGESNDTTMFSELMSHVSAGPHFAAFAQGNIKVAALVYFISVIVLACFLTQRVVESLRWR